MERSVEFYFGEEDSGLDGKKTLRLISKIIELKS